MGDGASMSRIIIINNCSECPNSDHTGAFTTNGSLGYCRHNDSPKNFKMSDHTDLKKDANRYIAKLNLDASIPDWCPLGKMK